MVPRGWFLALAMPWALAAEGGALARLPVLPRPEPQREVPAVAGDVLAPGIRLVRGQRVELDGTFIIDRGPPDGLEVLACLAGGKTHEALVKLATADGAVVKAAAIAALGLADGLPAREGSGLPARGTPVRLRLAWTALDGTPRIIDASCLIRDRTTDQPFQAVPWVWTGSRFETVRQAGPDGQVVAREQFMLEVTRSVAVNYDEPDALLASPFPDAATDRDFEANSRLCPPVGTPVRLLIEPAELPLTLDLRPDGSLVQGATVVSDAALADLLRQHYAGTVVLRAVAVRTGPDVDRTVDAAARTRCLAAAAAAGVWVLPVFTLPPGR